MLVNGSRAYALFKTSSHYVDLGFQMRYQAVFSDPKICECWGRGWRGPNGENPVAEVNKAAQLTLRTARKKYPYMLDWREDGKKGTKWYQTQGGANFTIKMEQSYNKTDYIVYGSFTDLWTGYYMLSYTPERIGTWKVSIEMDGPDGWEHINGSPFNVVVGTGPTDPKGSFVIDPATGKPTMQVGEPGKIVPDKIIMFRIQAGDTFLNKRTTGGDDFVVKLDGPQPVAGILKDMGDGTYNASFSVSKSGHYNVFVGLSYNLLYETAIYGSPFKIFVPKLGCPPLKVIPACSGHGTCQDNGKCKCVPAYDGISCQDELNKPLRQAIIYENIVLGSLLVIYAIYYLWTSSSKSTRDQEQAAMMGEMIDEDDEEVQFKGLKCCMHW